jgi:hypothetical protein
MDFLGFADWAIKLIMIAMFGFVWRIYVSQNDQKTKSALTEQKIEQIEKFVSLNHSTDTRVTQLEKDMARIEGKMITIETLKRVEIYMELILARSGINQKVDLTSGVEK